MSKPVFEQPYGLRYRVDDIQMELSWNPNFGAEKTAALQKAQFAFAQQASTLIDPRVPFATGTLKGSVNTASKFDEGLLVYNTPYARKQYYLHPKGECLHGENRLRGSYWGQRAIEDHSKELADFATKALAALWGGGSL